jgi:HSP20 family protein
MKLVNVLAQRKSRKKAPVMKKKENVPIIPKKRPPSMLEPYTSSDLWMEFDEAFDRFRRDFENLLWPSEELPMMREMETRMPAIDLEDRGDKYMMTVDVPGFRNDEIEINVWDSMVEISGCRETKQDEETKGYVRKERSSESFYRQMALPEEVKVDDAQANLQNGILELTLPKKVPKKKKKVPIK